MPSCTCVDPPHVDLCTACSLKDVSHDDIDTTRRKQKLRSALQRLGYCHISVKKSQLSEDSPLRDLSGNRTKEEVERLFHPDFLQSLRSSNGVDVFSLEDESITYRGRTAESGDSLALKSEPKQSWEIKRCRRRRRGKAVVNDDCAELEFLSCCVEALHSVSVMVTRLLDLPPNVLIKEDSCICESGTSRQCQDCNADLLRVFYYDAVENPETLGSSAHTDWGGLTVVWQDEIGGLETFCPLHERWIDVAAPKATEEGSDDDETLRFVVHVGDVTSLSMGHAASGIASARNAESGNSQSVWPSPRHRVVCPTNLIPRVSLVYFAYPPPGVTLQDMTESLRKWWGENTSSCEQVGDIDISYESYSLLQDQSANGTHSSALETFESIKTQPLQEVFSAKWQQVQRS